MSVSQQSKTSRTRKLDCKSGDDSMCDDAHLIAAARENKSILSHNESMMNRTMRMFSVDQPDLPVSSAVKSVRRATAGRVYSPLAPKIPPALDGTISHTDKVSAASPVNEFVKTEEPEPGETKLISSEVSHLTSVQNAPHLAIAPHLFHDEGNQKDPLFNSNLQDMMGKLGKLSDHYTIKENFAEGGFGSLSKGQDLVLERIVAVKTLHRQMLDDPSMVEKFINEARLSANLDHPNVVPIYDFDTDAEGNLHILMKYIDGITLKSMIIHLQYEHRNGHVSQAEEEKALHQRLEHFLRLCEAIEYAHSKNIVHGDLKPENVMIGSYGEVYVMDWGTAALAGTVYESGVNGTPSYLSPELCKKKMVFKSSDIFALGLILFELVTLSQAMVGDTVQELVAKIKAGAYEPIIHQNPSIRIDSRLVAILEKALQVDPEDRYPTVKALMSDVRNFILNEPLSVGTNDYMEKLMRWIYANRIVAFSFCLLLILSTTGYALYTAYQRSENEHRSQIRTTQYLKLKHSTDAIVDQTHNLIAGIRGRLRSSGAILIEDIHAAATRTQKTDQKDYYLMSDFKNAATAPPDMVFSTAYEKKISMSQPCVFQKPKSSNHSLDSYMDLSALMPDVRKVFIGLLLTGGYRGIHEVMNSKEAIEHIISGKGSYLQRVFLLFPETIIFFPGSSEDFNLSAGNQWYSYNAEYIIKTDENWLPSYPSPTGSGDRMAACKILIPGSERIPSALLGMEVNLTEMMTYVFNCCTDTALPPSDLFAFDPDLNIVAKKFHLNDDHGAFKGNMEKAIAQLTPHLNTMRLRNEQYSNIQIDNVTYILSIADIKEINLIVAQIMQQDALLANYNAGKLYRTARQDASQKPRTDEASVR